MMLQKCSKLQHIFAYNGLGLLLRDLHFRALVELILRSNWHVTLRLNRFRDIRGQMAKIGVWEAKNDPPEPLSWPHIWWPLKISSPRGEKVVQGHSSTILQIVMLIDRTVAEKHIEYFAKWLEGFRTIRHNRRTSQPANQPDTAQRYRPRLCVASRGKNDNLSLSYWDYTITRRVLVRAHVPPTKLFRRLAVNKTIVKVAAAQYRYR